MDLSLIEDIVFTHIITRFSSSLMSEFSMTKQSNFSTNSHNNTNSVFPYVYIHLMPAVEVGNTLDNTVICGGMYTFEIRVTDNKSQSRARRVMAEVVRIMKLLRFSVTSMPYFDNSETTYVQIARFRRVIGADDKF
jgi:hypothetical protein